MKRSQFTLFVVAGILGVAGWTVHAEEGTNDLATTTGRISEHVVTVGKRNGRTEIVINGQPVPGIAYLGPLPDEGMSIGLRESVEAGIRIVLVEGWGDWHGPGKWDFSKYIQKLERIAKSNPDLWLVLRFNVATPGWWKEAHPDELMRHADGVHPNLHALQASMGSAQWIADSSEFVAAMVRAAESSAAGPRILGYSLMCAHGGEWVYLGAGEGRIGDYSPVSLRYYRTWLRRKYGEQKWIDEVQIPSEEERVRSRPGLLRDPKLDARSIDYELAFSDMTVDNLLAWCRAVKQATGGKRLVGAFYGYLLWQSGLVNATATNGHLALRRLLESPDIDFVTSFPSYDVREPGAAAPMLLPVESIQQAGKLVFNECDDRTHRSGDPKAVNTRFHAVRDQRDPANGPQLWQGFNNLWPLESAQIAVDVVRREYAHHMIRGAAWWWFDMGGNWYSGPELQGEIRKQMKIADKVKDWDMSSISEVAGVVSGTSGAYHSLMRMFDVDPQASLVELQADLSTREMYKAGAPIDWWMMEDLALPAMQQYKVLYFHNATYMSESQRGALEKLKSDGRVLIFIGYPGLVNGEKLDEQAASRAVGMRLKLVTSRSAARFTPKDYDIPCLQDATSQAVMGSGVVVSPRLIVDDPEAQVILQWPDGQPAAAMRRHKDWTAYYFPVPPNNAQLFRAIFREAGCHVYTDSMCRDVIYANKSLLALHTNHYFQPVTLPRPARVTDLFTGKVVVEKGTRIVTGRAWHWTGGTMLYRVEYE